jgi:hypothetical protein
MRAIVWPRSSLTRLDPLPPSAIQSSSLPYSYSINSSALSRIDVGTSRPSALAVFILSTVSYSDRTLRAARRRFP